MSLSKLRAPLMIIPAVLAIGLITGIFLQPMISQLFSGSHAEDSLDVDEHDEDHDHVIDVHDDDHEDPHIALTQQAYQNLNLSLGEIEISDYTQTIRMPGEVQESPGISVQKVAAPVSGTIKRLFATPGISVTEGTPLFELAIIDDELMNAQLHLLELQTKKEIVTAELERLTPLAAAGGVVGRKQLEWEYQEKEVNASLARARQELAMRGLSEEQIEQIISTGNTISSLIIHVPMSGTSKKFQEAMGVDANSVGVQLTNWPQLLNEHTDLTVEELLVDTGQNIERGVPVCTLAAHGMLYVCGHAFENEVSIVSEVMDKDEVVDIEFGIEGFSSCCKALTIQYIDSHVDPQTQTYRFFVPLPNEVVAESTDSLGRRFRTWRYKVGQRVHVLIPDQEIEANIVLPRDAVVQDGPDAFVFRVHDEEEHEDHPAETEGHGAGHEEEHDHEDIFMEFEPVAVQVLHRDKSVAVIAAGDLLKAGDRVAMSSAYQLLLAMKAEQDGGGGHHHHH